MAELNFSLPSRVIYGSNELSRIGSLLEGFGSRAFLITDSIHQSTGYAQRVINILQKHNINCINFCEVQQGETTLTLHNVKKLAEVSHSEIIIGMGGVTALSYAKAAASLIKGDLDLQSYYEGDKFPVDSLPVFLIPTTYRDPFLFRPECILTEGYNRKSRICYIPSGAVKAVLFDTALNLSLTPKYTAAMILEILLSVIESYLSHNSLFFTDALLLDTIKRLIKVLDTLLDNENDKQSRIHACEAGIMSAFAFSQTGIGPGIGLSYSAANYFKVPRSSVATLLFPYLMETSYYSRLERLQVIAQLFYPDESQMTIKDAVDACATYVRTLIGRFKLPSRLSALGIQQDDLSLASHAAGDLTRMTRLTENFSADQYYNLLRMAY